MSRFFTVFFCVGRPDLDGARREVDDVDAEHVAQRPGIPAEHRVPVEDPDLWPEAHLLEGRGHHHAGVEAGAQPTVDHGRRRAHRVSTVLDDINRKYGNNSVYFGAMHQAIDQDAAPMRIPFAHVPETALEEEAPSRRRASARSVAAKAEELYLLRERQFKVMAENAHRESRKRRNDGPASAGQVAFKAGASGWSSAPRPDPEPEIGQTGNLF